jgi:hypothetical protein
VDFFSPQPAHYYLIRCLSLSPSLLSYEYPFFFGSFVSADKGLLSPRTMALYTL